MDVSGLVLSGFGGLGSASSPTAIARWFFFFFFLPAFPFLRPRIRLWVTRSAGGSDEVGFAGDMAVPTFFFCRLWCHFFPPPQVLRPNGK